MAVGDNGVDTMYDAVFSCASRLTKSSPGAKGQINAGRRLGAIGHLNSEFRAPQVERQVDRAQSRSWS